MGLEPKEEPRRITSLISVAVVACFMMTGCKGSWVYNKADFVEHKIPVGMQGAEDCAVCHEMPYRTWKESSHGDEKKMACTRIPRQYKQCGACHLSTNGEAAKRFPEREKNTDLLVELPEEAATFHESLVNPRVLEKSEVNRLCGKCHFRKEYVGRKSVNPTRKHQLICNVGFQDSKKILSCLDCHEGHTHRKDLMERSKSMICYKCHLAAEMWIFQPFNWPTFGQTCFFCHPPHGAHKLEIASRMVVGLGVVGCLPCHIPGAQAE